MNADKLRRLQAQVRIGGKGTPRRKKKVMHQSAATDDKKLQSSLKKLSVSTIPGIEEVNIIKDDLTVIHFNNPKAQASLSANTFAVTGHGETKKIVEMLPEILPQLGQDTVMQLRVFANTMSGNQKQTNAAPTSLGNIAEDDDVPLLVNDFEEVAKMDEGKANKTKAEGKKSKNEEFSKNIENVNIKEEGNVKKIDGPRDAAEKKSKKQQNKQQQQSANGAAKIKSDVGKNENKHQKQIKQEKTNKQEKTKEKLFIEEKNLSAEHKKTTIGNETKPKNETEVKKVELSQQKQSVEEKEKSFQNLSVTGDPKPTKEEVKKIDDKQAQQTVSEKSVKPADKPTEKKKEETVKENKTQGNKKKEDGAKAKEGKTQPVTKRTEVVKSQETKDTQKAVKSIEKNKDAGISKQDLTKPPTISHEEKIALTERKSEVKISQMEQTKIQKQETVRKEDTPLDKKESTINNLNKVDGNKMEDKEQIKPTNIVVAEAVEINKTDAFAKIAQEAKEIKLKSSPNDHLADTIKINLKPQPTANVLEDNKAEEKAKQQEIFTPQLPALAQPIKQMEQLTEKNENKIDVIDLSKAQIAETAALQNKQPSPKPNETKKTLPLSPTNTNNKKEDTKGKPASPPVAQAKPAKPTAPKPTLQTKPIQAAKTPEKSVTPLKTGTPTKAASPQPKPPSVSFKKTPSPTATPPSTPTEIKVATVTPVTDGKNTTEVQKKPATPPKPTQLKNIQQKSTNINISVDNKKQTAVKPKQPSPLKISPIAGYQPEQKKQASPSKADNTKQPQSPNILSPSTQQSSKQPSPTKNVATAKSTASSKQATPTKQTKPTVTQPLDEQLKNAPSQTSQPNNQAPKVNVQSAAQPKPNASLTSTQPQKSSSPQPSPPQQASAQQQILLQTPQQTLISQPHVVTQQISSQQPKAATSQLIATQPKPIGEERKDPAIQSIIEPQKVNTQMPAIEQYTLVSQTNSTIPYKQQSPTKASTRQPVDTVQAQSVTQPQPSKNQQQAMPLPQTPTPPTSIQNQSPAINPTKIALTPQAIDQLQQLNIQQSSSSQSNP